MRIRSSSSSSSSKNLETKSCMGEPSVSKRFKTGVVRTQASLAPCTSHRSYPQAARPWSALGLLKPTPRRSCRSVGELADLIACP